MFDIDGTLLTSGGAGERALREAVQERFGAQDDLSTIEIAGRTDSGIARQILRKFGLDESAENIASLLDVYLRRLQILLPQLPGKVLPGIVPLLEALKAMPGVGIGLLTGNLRRGAELKLHRYGLLSFFQFGAYADDHHDRDQLGHVARRRAFEALGVQCDPRNIFVLGDTPHDISCARAIGARAVAIATGGYSTEQLAARAPDLLFADLHDSAEVLRSMGLPAPFPAA